MKPISIQFELPVTSSEFSSDVTINHYQGETGLTFKYFEDDIEKQFRLTLHDVYMFSFITDICSTPFQIENAYEQLVIIEKSDWIKTLYKQAENIDVPIAENLRHFMIYIPDLGTCEWAALRASFKTTN